MNLDPGMAKWLAKHEGEWNGSAALVQMIRETSNMVTIVGSNLETDIPRAVSQKFGDHAVAQISTRVGDDVTSPQALEKCRRLQPHHLWVSHRCGPLLAPEGKLTGAQQEARRKRRAKVIKEYLGALQMVYAQVAASGHAHWE